MLIVKDDLIVTRIVAVKEHPSVARVVRVFVCLYSSIGNTELRGGRDTDEGRRDVGAFSILLDAVGEGLDPGEVDNGVVVVNRDGRQVVGCDMGEGFNEQHQVVSPGFHSIRQFRVGLSITQDSSAQSSGAQDLFRDPELVSPSRWQSGGLSRGISRGVSQTTRGVEEFHLLVGIDDGDCSRRNSPSSNI